MLHRCPLCLALTRRRLKCSIESILIAVLVILWWKVGAFTASHLFLGFYPSSVRLFRIKRVCFDWVIWSVCLRWPAIDNHSCRFDSLDSIRKDLMAKSYMSITSDPCWYPLIVIEESIRSWTGVLLISLWIIIIDYLFFGCWMNLELFTKYTRI